MNTFTQKVSELAWESKNGKKWRSVEVTDIKAGAKSYKVHLFPGKSDAVISALESGGAGTYELDKEKEGDYWKVVAARKVGGDQAAKQPGTPGVTVSQPGATSVALSRATVAAAALQAAAVLVGEDRDISDDDMAALVLRFAEVFRKDALSWVLGEKKEQPTGEGA